MSRETAPGSAVPRGWWIRCWWFRRHKWRTLWHIATGFPAGYRCDRCHRTSHDLMEPLYQGQRKGWML